LCQRKVPVWRERTRIDGGVADKPLVSGLIAAHGRHCGHTISLSIPTPAHIGPASIQAL
jgi:hypothetical protein